MATSGQVEKGMDPLGLEVEGLLAHTEPSVTPHQLLEIVTEALEKNLPGHLKGKARQNVLNFLVQNEYHPDSIRGHVSVAVQMRQAGRWIEIDPNDNSDRVDDLIEQYRAEAGEDEAGVYAEVLVINQAVGPGGLTKLHLAAMDGEYAECVRLVEQEGADPGVMDNLKNTPYARARAFGFHRVAEYLRSKMVG